MRALIPLSTLGALLLSAPASAVAIDWTFVGNPGNACETQSQLGGCFGAVPYAYNIGTYEVTNSQYAEFLNAVASVADPNALYDPFMGAGLGGITQTCSDFCTYSVIAGRGNMPVNYVSWYDTLRFANWLHNGQPTGVQDGTTTEDGAYTITQQGLENNSITRNPGATIFLTNENEWYKAAYHNAVGLAATDYFDYPASSDTMTTCANPTATANRANCGAVVGTGAELTSKGSYPGSPSPYGTFDQGGNVYEWGETIFGPDRVLRGGSYGTGPNELAASAVYSANAVNGEKDFIGFRVAMIPEPSTYLLVTFGLLGLAGWRRVRA
jgi:hypothetical protein